MIIYYARVILVGTKMFYGYVRTWVSKIIKSSLSSNYS